jgi:ribosomal protein S27AE
VKTKGNTPCPKCGSKNVAGIINAFFLPLENDEPKPNWQFSAPSETELGDRRSCGDCGHEWDASE